MSRTTLRTATGDMQLRGEADRDRLIDDSADLAFITIELRDTEGTLVTGADRLLSVEVTGAAILQALGSARPDPTEKYESDERTTFQGRLLAVVRPTGVGPVTVAVTTDGLEPVTVTSRGRRHRCRAEPRGHPRPRGRGALVTFRLPSRTAPIPTATGR